MSRVKLKKSEISEAYNGMTGGCFDNDSYGRAIQLVAKEQRASEEGKERKREREKSALHKMKPVLSENRKISEY